MSGMVGTRMCDHDIRVKLRSVLEAAYGGDRSTLIIDELGICCGMARVDMAVVNGHLKGFEIKSDLDNLARLPSQVDLYSKVFDTVTIVTGPRHLKNVQSACPDWWGIAVAVRNESGVLELEHTRAEVENTTQDPSSIVKLLWRDEVLSILRRTGLAKGLSNLPRKYLWEALTRNFGVPDLSAIVRQQLKSRENWRAALQPELGDARCPLFARS
jgi:hypothetical protein